MKILFVHLATMGLGDGIRHEKVLRFLKQSGFDVKEVCLCAHNIRRADHKEMFLSLIPLKLPNRPSLNPVEYFEFNIAINQLRRIIRNERFDVIFAEQTIFVGWIAEKIARENAIPCIVDSHGLTGIHRKEAGVKQWYITEALEKNVYIQCSHLLVVSHAMKKFIASRYGVRPSKITVIPNGADILPFSAKYDFPLKVIYAGGFGFYEKVGDYLEIARKADNRYFKFYLLSPPKKEILSQIRQDNLPIEYLGFVPRSKALKIMADMQVGIAPSTRGLTRIIASPIKVLDYMACGLPIITPKVGEWGQMIEKENCGITLENDGVDNYLDALELLKERKIWLRKSANGIRVVRTKCNWGKTLSPIKDVLLKVSNCAQ